MTKKLVSSKVSEAALAATVIVIAAAVEHAIKTHSLNPIWMIGWLPAVLLAFYQPGAAKRCAHRIAGRSRQ